MSEPTWEYILAIQQEDFLERLEASLKFYSDCDNPIYLSTLNYAIPTCTSSRCELVNIYFHPDEELGLDDFCTELNEKFNYENEDEYNDSFINNKLGKIGEEAVKKYLGNLINNVDYKVHQGGDGGVDFVFIKKSKKIKIQVKTTAARRLTCQSLNYTEIELLDDFHFNIYQYINDSKWQVNDKAIKECNLTIFVLVITDIYGDTLNENPYKCLIAGFLPSQKLIPNRKYSISELLYSGGIRAYLEHLTSNH